jgi:hypothetical protein
MIHAKKVLLNETHPKKKKYYLFRKKTALMKRLLFLVYHFLSALKGVLSPDQCPGSHFAAFHIDISN